MESNGANAGRKHSPGKNIRSSINLRAPSGLPFCARNPTPEKRFRQAARLVEQHNCEKEFFQHAGYLKFSPKMLYYYNDHVIYK